ncbi:MAG: hypothetical protein JNM00_12580 [Flavobacteriales bacterium]|nr:hypothetical protein [Flavobacteriales bacterium]
MKSDITWPEVKEVGVAIVPMEGQWEVFLLNMKQAPIENVLVSVRGYGTLDGRNKETATMRFFLDRLEANSGKKIENLLDEALGLTHQYWLTYYEGKELFEKKYIFVPGSVDERNFISLPLIHRRGVMIQ